MHKLLFLFVLLFTTSNIAANELEDRQVISDKVRTLFLLENYSALDAMASEYRNNGERTSSGLWKLTLFYGGIDMLPNIEVTTKDYWDGLEAKSSGWIKAFPESPSGYLAHTHILMRHAWMFRGSGWGYQVRSDDWKPFHEYVQKARLVLERNKEVASKDPQWYALMIDVATAQDWDMRQFNALLKEASARHPYFYQIYFEAVNYLTPKWHGSKEEIEKFARKVVGFTRAKEKNGMYARIYWVASQDNYGSDLFTKSAVVWKEMSKAIDDVIEQYPDQWNINNFAYFSCLAGDSNKTRHLISMIEGKPIVSAWQNMDFYSQCKAWSEAGISANLKSNVLAWN